MEWHLVLRMVIGWILWGLPVIVVMVAGAALFPFLVLAGAGCRLTAVVGHTLPSEAYRETQLSPDMREGRERRTPWVRHTRIPRVDVFPKSRATPVEDIEQVQVEEPEETRIRKHP